MENLKTIKILGNLRRYKDLNAEETLAKLKERNPQIVSIGDKLPVEYGNDYLWELNKLDLVESIINLSKIVSSLKGQITTLEDKVKNLENS